MSRETFDIAKDIGDKAGEGDAYTNLGVLYENLGNFQGPKRITFDISELHKKLETKLEKEKHTQALLKLSIHSEISKKL